MGGTAPTVTNTADMNFVAFRDSPLYGNWPASTTSGTYFVEPIFAPAVAAMGIWPVTVRSVPVAARTVVSNAGPAVTAVLTDAGAYLRFTGTNPTYTVPPNSTVAFPVGTQLDGTGTATAMTLIAGAGVTITRARTLVTVGAGSGWTLIKTGTDAWDLHGAMV